MDKAAITILRQQINDVDKQIVELLDSRAKLACAIGKAKGSSPVYDPSREGEVLQRIVALSRGPLPKGSMEDIYASIITACRELQLVDI